MKYLIFFFLIFTGCTIKHHDPIFKAQQKVTFKVDSFYQDVCSGKGTIKELIEEKDGSLKYIIETPVEETYCPSNVKVSEELIAGTPLTLNYK